MKKILLLFLVTATIITLFGCQKDTAGNTSIGGTTEEQEAITPNCDFADREYLIFSPTEPSSFGVEEFKTVFDSGVYTDNMTPLEYREVFSYIPEEIATKYNINAFEMKCYRDGEYASSRYYILYNGKITTANPIGATPEGNKGFVHFALSDINADGYYELLCSYNQNRVNVNGIYLSFSYLTLIDSKSDIAICRHATYNGSVFFKPDKEGRLAAYVSEKHTIEKANDLLTTFMPNTVKYTFKQRVIELTSENYKVEITFDKGNTHFPISCGIVSLYITVNTKMTYLGETFTYTSGDSHLDGALPQFVNGENTLREEGRGAATVVTKFTIKTGDVIEEEFKFLEYGSSPNSEGTYDMYVSYRGEEIFAEDVITITR